MTEKQCRKLCSRFSFEFGRDGSEAAPFCCEAGGIHFRSSIFPELKIQWGSLGLKSDCCIRQTYWCNICVLFQLFEVSLFLLVRIFFNGRISPGSSFALDFSPGQSEPFLDTQAQESRNPQKSWSEIQKSGKPETWGPVPIHPLRTCTRNPYICFHIAHPHHTIPQLFIHSLACQFASRHPHWEFWSGWFPWKSNRKRFWTNCWSFRRQSEYYMSGCVGKRLGLTHQEHIVMRSMFDWHLHTNQWNLISKPPSNVDAVKRRRLEVSGILKEVLKAGMKLPRIFAIIAVFQDFRDYFWYRSSRIPKVLSYTWFRFSSSCNDVSVGLSERGAW